MDSSNEGYATKLVATAAAAARANYAGDGSPPAHAPATTASAIFEPSHCWRHFNFPRLPQHLPPPVKHTEVVARDLFSRDSPPIGV